MAEDLKISDDEILSAFKGEQPTVSQPAYRKEEAKGISDEAMLAAFKGIDPGMQTSGGTLSGGGQMFRPEMVGSTAPAEQSSLVGSGALGSGQFAPIPVGPKGKFEEYAGITDPNTRKGIAETVFKGITDPHDLEELHDKVPWYNIAENPVQMESLFQYKWNKKADPWELAADAAKAGAGMLESLPPLVAGAGRLAKDALAGAVYVGDPSAFGKGRTLTDEEKKGMTPQQIQDAELSLRDKTFRSARVFGDAALEAEEQLRKAATNFVEGKSMLYDKARVAFANAGDYNDFSGLQSTPETIQEAEARKAAKTAELMADARKNFATRLNAKHVEHLQKEKNPAVLAREISAVWQYPAVKSFATDVIENLMPPAEDAAPGFGGDIEAAKAARRAQAAEAAEVGVQSAITEANRLREDPEQVGAVAMTTPVNVVGAGGMILGRLGRVNQALVRGLKAIGKTDQEINAMLSAESAAVQAQREATAISREQPGWLEKPLGSMADTADKIPGALAKIPQPVQYIGSALAGAGAGAAMSDDPLAGALKGATTGAGIKLGGKAILAAPRLGQELLKAGRLSGAELGRFEALEKMGSASPAVQKFVNWSQKAGGGKALDFIEKNANTFVQHNVSMLPMMVALGVLEDKDAKEFSQMWAEFATYGFLHGQVLGGMLGNDPVRMKMNRDAEMRQAQRVMQASSPETRDNLRNLNWDRVVEHSEARLERTKAEYAKQLEADPDSPETAQAKSDYDFAHQLHRQNLIAPPEARAAFEDGIKLSLAKASNLINGVLTPNSNMNVELLTTPQIYKKMIDANPNYNGVGAPLTIEQAMAMNPGADGVKIGKGISKDGFTMDAAKDTVFVNIDNAMNKARLTGEAIPNVLAHEVVGHGLFGKEEYRQKIAPLYNQMFGTEVMDENGNWREVTPAQPGLSREDLFEKFFTKYLAGKTPESVAQYAEAAGVWDKANNTFDKNKVVDLMREEVLAEAHAGRFFSDPESPAQRGISWLASRISGNNLKSALNHLYSVAGPAVYKQWTSGATGATYSPEVMRAIRNVEREMQKYDGEFIDAEQGEAVAAPITKKDVIKSREMLQKYYGDTGKFETTPVAVVTDKNGKVVRTIDLKDKEAFEGSWNYHQDEATGDNVPNKEKGFGELPPELAGVEVPVGGRVQVQRQIAYDEATGKPLERKNKETVEALKRRVQLLREAIDNAGDSSQLGRFRAIKGGQGKDDEDLHYTGKMTPEQRAAIAALPESVVPASMKELLFKYDDLMTRGDGTVLDIDYASRLNDKGNYQAFSPKIRQIVPLQLHLSKAGNFYTTAWDISDLRRKVKLYEKYAKGVFEPWGGDTQKFWNEFRTILLPNLANPDANVPGWQGLDADPNVAKLKRTIYEKMLGAPNPNVPDVESIPDLPREKFSRSEKKLDKQSSFDKTLKSFRLDAHTAAEENANSEFKYPIPYKARFMPEQEQAEEQRPALGGGILKGLQAVTAKYTPESTGEVKATVQPAEAQVRFMPAPTEDDYHHAEGVFPKTETSEPYKMSAIHKISEDGLMFADKMGGLAVPSIAVVKAGTGIQGFGNITLVGGRDLVDPKTNPVFSGDAYTQRFPRPEYPRVKTKKAQQVIDLFKPAQREFSQSYGDNVTDIIWDNAVNNPNPEEAVNKLKKSNVAKAAYLGDSAPKPITRAVPQDLGILDTAPMKEWLSKNSLQDINYTDVEARKSLGDAIKGGFDEIYPEELKGKANRIGSRFVSEDGQATVGAISRLEADLRNYGKTEIDSAETQKALDAALTGKESDFYQWVENTIEGMYEAPRIRVAGKWEPYNLENITRVMTSGKIAGVEKLMTQSTGLTAAQMAKRFGSMAEMRNTAEAPWGIRPEPEVNEARSKVSEVLREYRDAMVPFYKGSTWDALDTSMSALGAYYRSGGGGEAKMKQTLSKLGFTNVPSNVVKQAVEAANAMSAAPVKYFEAKPQRVVNLDEFQGAIVPDNVDPKVLSILQKNGIETRIIPSDKADDSAYIGSEIDKLKGGKQAQEQANIRFMPSATDLPVSKFEDEYRRVPTQEELDAMKSKLPKYSATVDVSGNRDNLYLIKLYDGEDNQIGYAHAARNPKDPTSGLEVESVHIEGDYRGKGYGQALYREIAKLAQGLGISKLTSSTTSRLAANARSKILETNWRGAGWDAESKVPSDIRFMPDQSEIDEQNQQVTTNEPGRERKNIGVRSDEAGDRGGQRTARGYSPLPGAPNVFGRSGPIAKISNIADRYAESRGIPIRKQAAYTEADVERGRRIAEEYAKMPHDPQNPRVQEAYADLIRQSADQYKALVENGYKAWFVDPANDPYEGKPWRAMRDLRENESMGVFPTDAGFGSGDTDLNVADNPLLGDSGLKWSYGSPDGPLRRVLWNDVFRYIHDAFGHGIEGAGFRADGEENAWQAHVRLFDGPAVAAMTTETRGQNSWLNFGPHADKNKTASVEDTVFADQKTGLMPEWTWREGVVPDEPLLKSGALSNIRFMPPKEEEPEKAKQRSSLRVRMTREALTDAALSQASWKDWYSEHQETLDDFFGDYAPLFQNILAITSQAASVKVNVGLALKAFGQLMRGEEFTGYLPAVAGNLGKLRDAAGPSGQKIQAYKAANEGDASSVVVDRHIARLLFGVDTPTPKQFAKAAKVLTQIAEKIGWTPAQVQAALWAYSIVQSGKQPESYGNYLKRLESQGGITKRIGGFGEGSAGADVVSGARGRYSPNDETSFGRVTQPKVTKDGLVVAKTDKNDNPQPFNLTQDVLTRFMPTQGVNIEDYADRTVICLPADRMGVGKMFVGPTGKKKELSVEGQGGRGFINIFRGGGWAFSEKGAASSLLKRLKTVAGDDDSAIVAVTAMSPINHLKNQTGQLGYVEALRAAIDAKTISKKQANAHIKSISDAIIKSTATSIKDITREKFKDIKSLDDLERAVKAKSLNFGDAEPLLQQMQRKTHPISFKEASEIGISFQDVARDLADAEIIDLPFGSVVSLLEIPWNQQPEKTDFHYSYPWTIEGKVIGHLKSFPMIGDLSSDPRIRNKAGLISAQPLQTVLPILDRIK